MAVDWGTITTIIALLGTVIGALWGLVKYISYVFDKQNQHYTDRFTQINGRFKDHSEKIAANRTELKQVQERITITREEMKADYVRHGDLDKKMDEHKSILNAMFNRLNEMAKDLNQMIGAHNGKVIKEDDDIGR